MKDEFKNIKHMTNESETGGFVTWNTYRLMSKSKERKAIYTISKEWIRGAACSNPITWDQQKTSQYSDHKGFLYLNKKVFPQTVKIESIDDKLLVMIASDRLSAFDVIMPRQIPFKGQILNQIATKMMKETEDLVPNWLIANPDENVAIGHLCSPFKVEMVIRGYMSGHAAREYKAGKRLLCGVTMAEGMKENDAFPIPIITPATKAEMGDHDEDISSCLLYTSPSPRDS